MKKNAFRLLLICSVAVSCVGAPQMPDIELKLIDVNAKKAHIYMLPKRPNEPAKHLRSEPLSLLGLDLHFAISIENYVKLEEYASALEAYAEAQCR